jgi:hypothetical protein
VHTSACEKSGKRAIAFGYGREEKSVKGKKQRTIPLMNYFAFQDAAISSPGYNIS